MHCEHSACKSSRFCIKDKFSYIKNTPFDGKLCKVLKSVGKDEVKVQLVDSGLITLLKKDYIELNYDEKSSQTDNRSFDCLKSIQDSLNQNCLNQVKAFDSFGEKLLQINKTLESILNSKNKSQSKKSKTNNGKVKTSLKEEPSIKIETKKSHKRRHSI